MTTLKQSINNYYYSLVTDRPNPSEDPNSGEAWVFLPLHQSIDLTRIDNVSFVFEFFMKKLLDVYQYEGTYYYMLSGGKDYINSNGKSFFAPLPLRVKYFRNKDGLGLSVTSE